MMLLLLQFREQLVVPLLSKQSKK